MVVTALLANLIPEALTGVLCFIFNSRHGVLVLRLHVLGEEVSRASNEAAVALAVTQPVSELGEDLVGSCSTSAHPPTCTTCPPGPELSNTKRHAFEFEASAPTEAGYVLGAFAALVVSGTGSRVPWELGVLSKRCLLGSAVLQPCSDAPKLLGTFTRVGISSTGGTSCDVHRASCGVPQCPVTLQG